MTTDDSETEGTLAIQDRLAQVRQRLEDAARRSGREPDEVTLVAVTKTRSVPEIREAIAAGATDFGENYVQEMVAKHEELAAEQEVRWHFIGHLQRNKVKYLAPFCALIHAVDSQRLAEEIDKRAAAVGRRQPVLIEVNVSGEESKFGVEPADVEGLARRLLELEHVELRGLMTMAPYSEDAEASRPIYARLRELAQDLQRRGLPPEALAELSMGMTQDFEVAVEEGATIVRVGRAIFGPRDY